MIKYIIKIIQNEEKKYKVNYQFFYILLNLFAFLSEKRGCGKKFDDQFLAKTDKYLPNFYIINLSSAIIPRSVSHTY